MLPGGGADDLTRLATIVAHTLRFRIGWIPWHASAVSDLALSLVLVRVRAVPRALAFGCVALTLVAVACDQTGQFLWLTRGLDLARAAAATGGRRVLPLRGVRRPADGRVGGGALHGRRDPLELRVRAGRPLVARAHDRVDRRVERVRDRERGAALAGAAHAPARGGERARRTRSGSCCSRCGSRSSSSR